MKCVLIDGQIQDYYHRLTDISTYNASYSLAAGPWEKMGSGNGTGWNCIALMLNTKITVSHPISTSNIVLSGKAVNINMGGIRRIQSLHCIGDVAFCVPV